MLRNRYQILNRLGQGGMGEVFAARDRLTQQLIALKRVSLPGAPGSALSPGLAGAARATQPELGAAAVARPQAAAQLRQRLALAQEFRTLAALRHPNIISVLDYGFDETQQPFYTMELLLSPQTILEAGREASQEARLRLIAQLLRALAYLHRHGILHRDGGEIEAVGSTGI